MPPEDNLITQPGADPANPGAAGADPANPNPNPTPERWYKDDWRKQMAGGDEKLEKRLGRFTDPNAITKSWLAAEQKISSGEFKRTALPENPTPEQMTQWRADNGIPEAADKYDIQLDQKLYTEDDKPTLDEFYKFAHENHFPKSIVEKIVQRNLAARKEQADKLAEMDADDKQAAEEALRADFGAEYKINNNIMSGLLDGLPEDIKTSLINARLPDGKKLTNDPSMVKMLVGWAREINPAATVVPSVGGANAMKSIGEEIADIETSMKTDRDGYFKDKKKQARYKELIVAQGQLQKKAG